MASLCVSAELADAEELDWDVEFLGSGLGETLDDVFALSVAGGEGDGWVGTEGRFRDGRGGGAWSHTGRDAAGEGEGFGPTGVGEAEKRHGVCGFH